MVPAFFAAVMIALFAMQYFSHASSLTTVLWAATMIAVIARLGISVRENKRLLEQVRTDQLTGLGNQGRLQVDLEARCQRAERGAADPAAARPQRLQALQRHLRSPGGRRDPEAAGRQLRMRDRRGRLRLPHRRRRVRASSPPAGRIAARSVTKRAAEALTASGRGLRAQRRLGRRRDPSRGGHAGDSDAVGRREDVRAEGVAAAAHDDALEINGGDVSVQLSRPRDGEALEQSQ